MEFRPLKENEIECRVAQTFGTEKEPKGLTLLLYKTARTDSSILDETVGADNWQNKFYECKGNLFCSVGINVQYGQPDGDLWIWKDDCGSESNMEREKGEASDAFKRACATKWGIGKELYTSPFIYVNGADVKKWYTNSKGNLATYDKFRVKHIKTENGKIVQLAIFDDTSKKDVFKWGF